MHASVSGKATKGQQELQEAKIEVQYGRINQRRAKKLGLMPNFDSYNLDMMAAANKECSARGLSPPFAVPTPCDLDFGEKFGFDWLRPGASALGVLPTYCHADMLLLWQPVPCLPLDPDGLFACLSLPGAWLPAPAAKLGGLHQPI